VTKDYIIRMAREAGFVHASFCRFSAYTDDLERFANLIAAHKEEVALAEAYRCGYKDGMEAGAVICENVDKSTHPADLATAIRNRGCWECGERWEFGSASTCKCKKLVKKREWVGLTDDEREAIANSTIRIHGQEWAYATAIEAKLKEKNT